MSDPWQGFAETHHNDERITAPITKITDFGIFIGLEGGIEGLVHLGDISWSERGEAAINRFSEGDVVDTVILSIDVERQRVSLGIKQVDNPYEAFAEQYAVGDRVIGHLREIDFGKLIVGLPGHLKGLVRLSTFSFSEVRSRFTVGDELALIVKKIWPRHGVIELGLEDDEDDSSPVPVEPSKPPSPKPLSSSRNR
ncbi:MAG: S1 RNA-binding domain-containing protein [Pseudomonadales bacterium]